MLPGAAFHELSRLTTIAPPPAAAKTENYAGGAPATPPVQVLERKESGPFDIAVLQASQTGGLFAWLHDNGFPIDPKNRSGLDYYAHQGWVFIAARMPPGQHRQRNRRNSACSREPSLPCIFDTAPTP